MVEWFETKPTGEYCSKCGAEMLKYRWMGGAWIYAICNCESEEANKKEESAQKRQRQIVSRAKANIPERYRWESFDTIEKIADQESAVKSLSKPGGVFLCGGVGNGKTLLMCCAANKYIDDNVSKTARFISAPEYIAMRTRFKDEEDECKSCDALFLDDLGAEHTSANSDWSVSMISELIDARYNSELDTYITSNLPPEKLRERYGDRVLDRIKSMCRIVRLTSGSVRMARK